MDATLPQAAVADALKTKRSVQLATALQKRGGEAGELKKAYDKVQPLQGNVVDLSGWDLADGGSADGCVADLIYRAPGCHEGDIRGFTHVPPPRALREMLKGGSSSRLKSWCLDARDRAWIARY